MVELRREMARVKRTGQPLVVGFVDVDGLKAINDSGGHAAGDRMLVQVANTLRAKLRSYDLILRYGGDEFLCAISGLNMADIETRLGLVNRLLKQGADQGSVTFGLAELQADESPEDVIERADAALYHRRRKRQTTPPPKTSLA